MRTGAIVCFLFCALTGLIAAQKAFSPTDRPDGFENVVGYIVGLFLLPMALLIVGLILWGKSGGKKG